MAKEQEWDPAVRACICQHFPLSVRTRNYYLKLWESHLASGLASRHFVSEITAGSPEKFRQRLWEMALGSHLQACGHKLTSRPEGEPDFKLSADGRTVWVEAISPTPGPDIPLHWTSHAHPGPSVGDVPNREMLLRWTAAFKEKAQKGDGYLKKGIIGPDDAYVIAIDGSQLCKFPQSHGISQLPFVVESVFAVGSIAYEIERSTGKVLRAVQSEQHYVENRNNAQVAKLSFLLPDCTFVSAVLGCYSTVYDDALLPTQIAYNPMAKIPLIPGVRKRRGSCTVDVGLADQFC